MSESGRVAELEGVIRGYAAAGTLALAWRRVA